MTTVIDKSRTEKGSVSVLNARSANAPIEIAIGGSRTIGTEPSASARRNRISGRERRAIAVVDLPPYPPAGSDYVIKVDTIRPCWLSEIEADTGNTTNPEYATRFADLGTAHAAMRLAAGRSSYSLRIDTQPSLKKSMTLQQALNKHVQRFTIKASTLHAASLGEFCKYEDVLVAFRIWQAFNGGPALNSTMPAAPPGPGAAAMFQAGEAGQDFRDIVKGVQ